MSSGYLNQAAKTMVCPFMRKTGMKIDKEALPILAKNFRNQCPFLRMLAETNNLTNGNTPEMRTEIQIQTQIPTQPQSHVHNQIPIQITKQMQMQMQMQVATVKTTNKNNNFHDLKDVSKQICCPNKECCMFKKENNGISIPIGKNEKKMVQFMMV